MNESDVLTVAERAASSYCKRYGAYDQYDDAVGEASLFLLEHRSIWNKPSNSIHVQVVGALVRNYQNARGLRLKNPPKFVAGVDLDLYSKKQEDERCDPRLEFVQSLLKSPRFEQYAQAILELVDGVSKKRDIAARHNLSQGQLRRIYNEFRIVCTANARGVTIVDPRAFDDKSLRKSCPLFFA